VDGFGMDFAYSRRGCSVCMDRPFVREKTEGAFLMKNPVAIEAKL
jgi:hypothetical protein